MSPTRREHLWKVSMVGAIALAGCLGGGDEPAEESPREDVDPSLQLDGVTLSSSFPIELHDPSGERLMEVHWHEDGSHWHQGPLELPVGSWRAFVVRLQDRDLNAVPLGPDEPYSLVVEPTESTAGDLLRIEVSGSNLNLRGERAGQGALRFEVERDGEVVWEPPTLSVRVSG